MWLNFKTWRSKSFQKFTASYIKNMTLHPKMSRFLLGYLLKFSQALLRWGVVFKKQPKDDYTQKYERFARNKIVVKRRKWEIKDKCKPAIGYYIIRGGGSATSPPPALRLSKKCIFTKTFSQ